MLDEAASLEGRKAYLEQRAAIDLNSGLSSPQSELQPVTSVKPSKDQTMIELSSNKRHKKNTINMPATSSPTPPDDPEER